VHGVSRCMCPPLGAGPGHLALSLRLWAGGFGSRVPEVVPLSSRPHPCFLLPLPTHHTRPFRANPRNQNPCILCRSYLRSEVRLCCGRIVVSDSAAPRRGGPACVKAVPLRRTARSPEHSLPRHLGPGLGLLRRCVWDSYRECSPDVP
jgi:hypothetical protein